MAPFKSWTPLDAAAKAAVQKNQRSFVVAKNGVQVVDRATGFVRVTRHNEKVPRAMVPKKKPLEQPRQPPDDPAPPTTAADYAAERQAAFVGEEHCELRNNVFETLKPAPTAAAVVADAQRAFTASPADVARAAAAAKAAAEAAKPPPKTKPRSTLTYRRG